jgi:hypothetical protein
VAYGTRDKALAERKAANMRVLRPGERFEVEAYETRDTWSRFNERTRAIEQWGVVHYVPYCAQMPYRCAGFLCIF